MENDRLNDCKSSISFAALLDKTPAGKKLRQEFFREEYTLNYLTGTYKLPYVAIVNGITMGGVRNISINIDERIICILGLWSFSTWSI